MGKGVGPYNGLQGRRRREDILDDIEPGDVTPALLASVGLFDASVGGQNTRQHNDHEDSRSRISNDQLCGFKRYNNIFNDILPHFQYRLIPRAAHYPGSVRKVCAFVVADRPLWGNAEYIVVDGMGPEKPSQGGIIC